MSNFHIQNYITNTSIFKHGTNGYEAKRGRSYRSNSGAKVKSFGFTREYLYLTNIQRLFHISYISRKNLSFCLYYCNTKLILPLSQLLYHPTYLFYTCNTLFRSCRRYCDDKKCDNFFFFFSVRSMGLFLYSLGYYILNLEE